MLFKLPTTHFRKKKKKCQVSSTTDDKTTKFKASAGLVNKNRSKKQEDSVVK